MNLSRLPISMQTSAVLAAFFLGVSIASALAQPAPEPAPVCPPCPVCPACPEAAPPAPPTPEVQDAIQKAIEAIQAAEKGPQP